MKCPTLLHLFSAAALLPAAAFAQFSITGVADKTTYNNAATLTVVTQAGYTYSATLNYTPIALGAAVLLNKPDFYEVRVEATNTTTSAVTSQYLRFIVLASERVDTEWGLPPHVPFPMIQSCSNEFAGAHFRFLAPASFPAGYPVPVITWVLDEQDRAVRANGILKNSGRDLFKVKRGVGSGLVSHTNTSDPLALALDLQGLSTNLAVVIESNVVWTPVSGALNGSVVWTNNSRIQITGGTTIPAGSSLTVEAGTIVRVNPGVEITNNGTITINGTVPNPVVFMAATTGAPWGGFVQHANNASFTATGAIFTGSGEDPCWYSNSERGCATGTSGLGSHRTEEPLVSMNGTNCNLSMTDSAAVYLAGQVTHAEGGATKGYDVRFTRFLMQRATSCGQFTAARITAIDSAFIECPDESVNFEDEDHDAMYIVGGTHAFTNTLFGWTKDDGIDSGGTDGSSSGGFAQLSYQSCWFESTFHEGNSWSGYKNIYTRGSVYFDCGQGVESGYDAPTGRVDSCFFSMCESGIRHGDNYATFSMYDGRVTATNNISIYNHRDIFGFNWDNSNNGGWTNSYDRFFATNNLVSALDTNYPNNTLWNPATDGWRLGAFGGVGRVGAGFGARGTALAQFPDGIPVGLSRFCTNEVRVDYVIDGTDISSSSGTLIFPAGLTRRFISVATNLPGTVRVSLLNPVSADITGPPRLYFVPGGGGSSPTSTNQVLLARGSDWKYWDVGTDQGTAWRAPAFNDGSWSNGLAQLGFGDGDETKAIRRTNSSGGVITTFYFRRAFNVTDPAAFTNLSMWLLRDDGGVVYLNGSEVYRSPSMPQSPAVITFQTFATNQSVATAPADNTIDTATLGTNLLVAGTNLVAVEIHQHDAGSSDVSFDFELTGNLLPAAAPPPRLFAVRFPDELVLHWNTTGFGLEEADLVTGPWRLAGTNSPSGSTIVSNRFFRLRK